MTQTAKRVLSAFLSALLVFSLMPVSPGYATENQAVDSAQAEKSDTTSDPDGTPSQTNTTSENSDQPDEVVKEPQQGDESGTKPSSNASEADKSLISQQEQQSKGDDSTEAEVTTEDEAAEVSAAEEEPDKVEVEGKAVAEPVDKVDAEAAPPHVTYRTHVQNVGWQGWKRDGAMSGTSGRGLRLEGIELKLQGASGIGSIEYRTHVQNVGWQGWKRDGAMSGTSGRGLRLEAIQIRLTGAAANTYDVWYHVHAQNKGWMGWTKNGDRAGTATYGWRLEGIEIKVLPKGSAAPGTTKEPFATRRLQYRTHVQDFGWQGWSFDGAMSGTSGKGKRLEGINIVLGDRDYGGGIQYRTHVQNIGWQGWKRDGAMSGTSGRGLRLEAIKINLYGDMANHYDVWYRVHAQNIGWMGWAKNGAQAGTAGYGWRLEGIQILLTPKNSAAPSTNYRGIRQANGNAFAQKGSSATNASSASRATSRGPKSAGALKVSGNQLVDSSGKAIQLHGVSTHGLAWFPQYVNDACFKQLRNEWNANVVRLAMYTKEYGGYCTGGNKTNLRKLVKSGVRYATNNDLYAIVDWHILSDGNPNTHVNEAKEFFNDISSTFKGNNNVIYEICNEPNGGTSWDQIRSYAEKVIPVIRRNDPDAIIIVGTPTWSQEVDKAAAKPLRYANVMYALHFYAATHKDDLRNRMVRAVKGGLPVFVTEFGICDASGNGAIDQSSANSWVTTMNSLGVSWCMWSLCNKAESASAIKSSCGASSGFKTGDLSTSGNWLLKALNGSLPAGADHSTTQTGGGSPSAPANKSVTFKSGNFTCVATFGSSWQAGNGKTCYQYDLSIKNNGGAVSSWSVTVPFNKSVSVANGWNGTFAASGSNVTIRNANYNGSIAAGGKLDGIGFQVTAASGLDIRR